MNMPGFTAELSLYRTSGRYQLTKGQADCAGLQMAFRECRATDITVGFKLLWDWQCYCQLRECYDCKHETIDDGPKQKRCTKEEGIDIDCVPGTARCTVKLFEEPI